MQAAYSQRLIKLRNEEDGREGKCECGHVCRSIFMYAFILFIFTSISPAFDP